MFCEWKEWTAPAVKQQGIVTGEGKILVEQGLGEVVVLLDLGIELSHKETLPIALHSNNNILCSISILI